MSNMPIQKSLDKILVLGVCMLSIIAYACLHTCFNIYYEDDSWTISNAWNLVNLGVDHDLIFLDQEGEFTGQLFGKIYFLIIGNFLNLVGWTKSSIFFFNSALIFASAFVWYAILKRLPQFCDSITRWVPLLLPIFPPCFFAAHTGRIDAFTLFLLSIGFLMFIKQKYFFAGLLSAMAIESHMMGVVTLFYYLSYFIYSQKTSTNKIVSAVPKNLMLRSIVGFSVGVIIYGALHYKVFDIMQLYDMIRKKTDMVSPVNNYLLAYFTDFDWYYHLPEAALFVFTIVAYIKHKLYRDNPMLAILLLVLLVSTLITRRENRNYVIYLAPVMLLFYCYTYKSLNHWRSYLVAFVLICMTYYSFIYNAHKDYKFDNLISFIDINTRELDVPIVGMPDIWFAAMDRPYYPIHNERDFNKINLEDFYLVKTDYLSKRSRVYEQVITNIYTNYNCNQISEWQAYKDNKASICYCISKGEKRVKIKYKPYPGWQQVIKKFMPASIK